MNQATLRFSRAALVNIEETSADWRRDLSDIVSGETTAGELLAQCLDGADSDRAQGWHDYVDALS